LDNKSTIVAFSFRVTQDVYISNTAIEWLE
jgi:hypothetical protein